MTPAEKDAFIASKLFGQELSYEKCEECFGTGYILDPDPDPDEGACCSRIECPKCGGKPYYLLGYPRPMQYYSTDVKAAWSAIEKMGELGYTLCIEWKGVGRVYAGTAEVTVIKEIYTVGHGVGSLPEATCNAIIMALNR